MFNFCKVKKYICKNLKQASELIMNYQDTLQYLFSQLPMFQRIGGAAYKADLNTTLQLDDYFQSPHRNFISVHIAGTNGKGSVSHIIASVLQHCGYKTGLYTSPHMIDFRERIKINGQMITEEYVVEWVEQHKDIFDKLKPSFFEMTVALAFDYFAKQNVDIAVVEVGMGGRLDSTNIITPILSVITNIGFDHTQFLGDTLSDIAKEKGGIIKNNIPVVIGEHNKITLKIFEEIAHRTHSELIKADEAFRLKSSCNIDGFKLFEIENCLTGAVIDIELDLQGDYQKKNIITALTALSTLGKILKRDLSSSYKAIKHTAHDTGFMGRWQILRTRPYIVADIAHNIDGIRLVVEQIKTTQYKELHIVLGVVNDKDVISILKALPTGAHYYFTQPSIPRALSAEKLHGEAQKIGLKGEMHRTVAESIKSSVERASSDDMIYIGGSAFVVADALYFWQNIN